MFAPKLAEQFKEAFTFGTFVDLEPEAYAPLISALSTITTAEKTILEEQKKIALAGKEYLTGQEYTLDNITKRYQEMAEVSERLLMNDAAALTWLERINKEREKGTEYTREDIALAAQALKQAMAAFAIIEEATESKRLAELMLPERQAYVSGYKPPGSLAFMAPETTNVQALLDKYAEMFRGLIDSQKQIYHAFVRDEAGMVTGFMQTFEAQPEVWSAMLAELAGIESNTSKALEAEYNLPAGYAVPSRYWYYKTTGSTEFGPQQKTLWAEWQRFVGDLDAKDITTPVISSVLGGLDDATDIIVREETKAAAAARDFSDVIIYATDSVYERLAEAAKTYVKKVPEDFEDRPSREVYEKLGPATQDWTQPKESFWDLFSWDAIIDWMKGLTGFAGGGEIPSTGPYMLHKGEQVSSVEGLVQTNNILMGMSASFLISQQYLSSINIGITDLRTEVRKIRKQLGKTPEEESEFPRVAIGF